MMKCPLCGSENVGMDIRPTKRWRVPVSLIGFAIVFLVVMTNLQSYLLLNTSYEDRSFFTKTLLGIKPFTFFLLLVLAGVFGGVEQYVRRPKQERILKCNECGNEKKVEKVN